MPTTTAQDHINLTTKLLYLWEIIYVTLLMPILINQRAHGKKTYFSTSHRQPIRTIFTDLFPTRNPKWLPERDMPDQTGKVAIVTGGNSGIGYETVRGLMRKGARVYMACRSHQRAAKSIEKLRKEGERWPGEVKFLSLDLSDMESIRSSTEEFLRQESQLHILICNAGAANPKIGSKTNQGYDLTLGTNVLGHQQFIRDLLPILQKTANTINSSNSNHGVRVHLTSSWAHNVHQPSGFDVNDPQWSDRVNMNLLGVQFSINPKGPVKEILKYGHSKFLNVCQAKKFDRIYGDKGIIFTSSDPGNNSTELLRNRDPISNLIFNYIIIPFFLFHPKFGAISQLYACTAPEAHILGGQFLGPWARITPAAPLTDDRRVQDISYEWLNKQITKNGY